MSNGGWCEGVIPDARKPPDHHDSESWQDRSPQGSKFTMLAPPLTESKSCIVENDVRTEVRPWDYIFVPVTSNVT